MELSKNKAKNVDTSPWLKECFEKYFAPGQFVFDRSHLVDVKFRVDMMYAVMLFDVNGELMGADVAGRYEPGGMDNTLYEVCNDSLDFDEASWKTVQVDRHTDGFTTKEDRE